MKLLVPNMTWSLCLGLTMIKASGFWWPRKVESSRKILWRAVLALISFTYVDGIYIIVQTVELVCVFGDVSRMTSAGFILFTNMALCLKMINVVWRRDVIHQMVDEMDEKLRSVEGDEELAIIRSMNKLTTGQLYIYMFLAANTVYGLAASVQKPELPLPARYPYDSTKSPAFELTYFYQVSALNISALINISLDTLVTSLIAQCCCRFKLLALSLKNLCHGLEINSKMMLSEEDEKIAFTRLRSCIEEHQAILLKAIQIQNSFSMPMFCQLTVSSFIICVTAYQLVFEKMMFVRMWSLLAYLTVMTLQVFVYCYQCNELSIQSAEISTAAFQCQWYACSTKLRRTLLMLMVRSVRVVYITAGGITTLSIGAFMRIIKGSYSFFTVLQTV